MFRLCMIVLLSCFCFTASAHSTSKAHLDIKQEGEQLTGSLQLLLSDLEVAVGLDANLDGAIRWSEVQSRQQALKRYVLSGLVFKRSGKLCTPQFKQLLINKVHGKVYAYFPFILNCSASGAMQVQYNLMFEHDANHRVLWKARFASVKQSGWINAQARELKF